MSRSERPESDALRRENTRLSQEVADLKRRVEEFEQGFGGPVAQDTHDQAIRQIIDLVPHSLFVKDVDGRFILVNQATATLHGLTVENMTGRTMDELYSHQELVARYRADDLEVVNTGKAKHIAEEPFIDRRGRKRWHQAIKIPYRTADSGKPAILCISQDITEQKEVQEALRESEQRFANHITHTPVAAILWDTEFRVKEWNPAAEKIFGFTADEAVGRRATELILPESEKEDLEALFQRALRHEGGEHNSNMNVTKDGRSIFVDWYNTPLRDTAGKTIGVAAFAMDVTDKKSATESLSESENKYRSLFETSLDGILFTDIDGNIQEANAAFLDMLGYRIDQLRGRNIDELTAPEWRSQNQRIRKKILTGPYGEYQKEYIRRDGEVLPVSVHAWPVGEENEPPQRFMGIVRDISERKAAEMALEKSQQLLRTVTDNVPAAISYIDKTGHYRFVNKTYEDWYGRPRSEIIGLSIAELVGEKSFRQREPLFRRALAGEAIKIDLERDYPALGRRITEVTYVPDIGADGKVRGLFGLGQDVTERRQAVNSLSDSEARLAEAQRIAKIGNWDHNITTGELYWSDEVYRIFGVEQKHFPPSVESFFTRVFPDDVEFVKTVTREKTHVKQPYGFEYRIIHADGAIRWVRQEAEPYLDQSGAVIRHRGTLQDITERKAAEIAFEESQQLLRTVTDNLPAVISYLDTNGRYRFVNKSYEDWYGRPRDEFIGMSVLELIGEKSVDIWEPYFRRALAGEAVKFDLERDYPNLGQRTMEITYMPDIAANGQVQGLFGLGQDVSERRAAEEALRKSEAGLAEAQRITKIGSWEHDIKSGDERWSDQYFRLLGHEPGAFKPSYADFLGHVHPDDLERVKSENANLATAGRKYDTVFRIIRADGAERVVNSHGHMFRDEAYIPLRTAGTFRDITEQLEAEEALRRSEQNLRGIMENVADGVITIDERGTILSFNHSAEDMFGHTAEEMIGRTVEELMGSEDRRHHQGYIDRYLETGIGAILGKGPREVHGRHKDGTAFPLELTVSEMHVGEQRTFIGTLRDISERRLVEDQLRQAQKMEAVGQLTGGIAHDFNNLLAVMLGNLELLRDYVDAGDKPGQMIDRAVQAAERGATLTNRLLSFSRNQMLQPEVIDLNNLIAGTTDMLRVTLGEAITLDVAYGESLWVCKVDVSQLENAILNLAINARDAMPGGGGLTVKTTNISLDDGDVAAQLQLQAGDYVVLSVADTGTGIPDDVLDRVFDPFFSTKDVGQGSGLGLSMVYGFAKQSGGHADIKSDDGGGAIVRVFLPRSSERPNAIENSKSAECEPHGQGEKILVVEDNADVRALALDLLHGLGYETFEAADGKIALDVLQQSPPVDLLLSDIVLPGGMNGRELAGKVREFNPAIKILYMSGYADSAFAEPAQLKGDTFLLTKPFGKASLAEAVRNSLDEELTRT